MTPDSLLFLYIPEEVQACDASGLCTDTTINGDACGFHSSMDYNGQEIAYAVIPSPGDTSGCDATLTSPSNDLVVDNAINAEAHELAEAVTNSFNGRGWSDLAADQTNDGGEIGDKCEHDFPGRGSVLADGGNLTLNGHDYILQSLWSDLDNGCTLGRVAVPYLDAQGIQTLQVEDGSPSILITGHSFSPRAVVLWNGTAIPTTYHSSQELGASIPAGDLARPGVAIITVSQQGTAGGTSNPQAVYIIPSSAKITSSSLSTDFAGTTAIGTAGQHTLMLEKTGGVFLLVDDFVVQNGASSPAAANVQLTNDTDPKLSYSGSGWGYYGARPGSVFDIQNDVHATTNDGDSVSYTFTGTGVSYISEKSDGYGLVDVYLDGQFQQTVDANLAGVHNQGGQILFNKAGLAAGQHSIKLVKKSGGYLLLDAFLVQP